MGRKGKEIGLSEGKGKKHISSLLVMKNLPSRGKVSQDILFGLRV